MLLTGRCATKPEGRNLPPTVIITSVPYGIIPADSVGVAWAGYDGDGTVVGYYYSLDNPVPDMWTTDTMVMLRGLSMGQHEFFVQAVDDAGSRSATASCAFRIEYDSLVMPLGTDTTLEIATWNIENFPKAGDSTVIRVRSLMARLDLDIYAIQEIADTLAFLQLLSGLPGYAGLYSRDDYGSFYQKTGGCLQNRAYYDFFRAAAVLE